MNKDVERAWQIEIENRIRDLDSGVVKSIPWKKVRDRLYRKCQWIALRPVTNVMLNRSLHVYGMKSEQPISIRNSSLKLIEPLRKYENRLRPGLFSKKDRGIRRYLVHRFPYAVMYRIKDRLIQIIAMMHLRRHPDYWHGRVLKWE